MMTNTKLKPIKKAKKVKVIKAKELSWKKDPKGYFLIKLNYKDKTIHAGYCTNDNILRCEIIGKKAEDICYTITKLGLTLSIRYLSSACALVKEAFPPLKFSG